MINIIQLAKKNRELMEANDKLMRDNLKLRLEMEIMVYHPEGKAAAIIRDRHKAKDAQRNGLGIV